MYSTAETSQQKNDSLQGKNEPRPRRRINFDVSAEAGDKLDELAKKSGKSMAEIIRTSLAIYAIIQEEKSLDHSIGVLSKEKSVLKELVMPM
jgi:predicted DNA-binding protein